MSGEGEIITIQIGEGATLGRIVAESEERAGPPLQLSLKKVRLPLLFQYHQTPINRKWSRAMIPLTPLGK